MAMQTRIKQRFDPLSSWIQNDIVLLRGELAVVDCGSQVRFKIGDGIKRFTQLSFVDQSQLCTHWIAADAISQGLHAKSVPYGFAAGVYLCANANFSQALGFNTQTISSDLYSFVWNGDDTRTIGDYYQSHGKGSFSINPLSGLSGFYLGEQNLAQILAENRSKTIIDNRICGVVDQTDLSIVKLNAEDYAQIVATSSVISNCLYIVESSYTNAYGQQIKNVAPGTELSDAVNLEQLNAVSASAPTKVSQLQNDSGYTTNVGTITGITMNGTSKGTSGNVNLGDVLTAVPSTYKTYTDTASSLSSDGYTTRAQLDTKSSVSVDNEHADVNILHISQEEYNQLVVDDAVLSNTVYVVSSDYIEAYGQQLKNLAAPTDLSDATNKEYVDNKVSSIHIPTDLSTFSNSPGYLTKTSADSIFQPIGNYLLSNDVSISYSNNTIWLSSKAYVTSVDCTDFIKDGMLSTVQLCGTTLVMNFNTDAGSNPISVELSNFVDNYDEKINDLSDHIDKKIFVSDSISGISGYSDLSVIKLNASEYSNLLTSDSLLSNAIYIVEDVHINAYGQQIKNIANPTDLSDAANKEYVDTAVSGIQIPSDLSSFSNSLGYVTEDDLSGYYTKSETSSAAEISAEIQASSGNKIYIDDQVSGNAGYSDLSVVKLSAEAYAALVANDQIISNAIYIVENSYEDMYGQQIKNLAVPTDLSDAATKGYVDGQISSKTELSDVNDTINEQVVPAIFRNVQLVKPIQPEGHHLHLHGDIARDDQFEDMVVVGIDTADGINCQFIKYFISNGESGTWETMTSAGLYTDADEIPASFYFADALSAIGEIPKISSQYFLRYYWYYDLSGTVHKSDQFSIAIPSNTAVGANPGDVIHKDEFYDLKQTVQPLKCFVAKDSNYNQFYICKPMVVSEISTAVVGQFDVLLEDYEASQIYRMQFTVGSSDATPRFFVDYGNGPELAEELKVNQDSYTFKAEKRYYTEIQGDVLKVDTLGYAESGSDVVVDQVLSSGTKIATISVDGNSTDVYAPADLSAFTNSPGYLTNNRYQLVTAQLQEVGVSGLSCQVDDQTITTIQISSSTLPISVYLPEIEEDGARDFIIRLEVTSSTVPTIGFYSSLNESIDFESEDEAWMEIEPGLNLISFTETR